MEGQLTVRARAAAVTQAPVEGMAMAMLLPSAVAVMHTRRETRLARLALLLRAPPLVPPLRRQPLVLLLHMALTEQH